MTLPRDPDGRPPGDQARAPTPDPALAPAPAFRAIGVVESTLTSRSAAPRQGDEGAPDAWLALDPSMLPALAGLQPGDDVVVVTWLDRADRDTLVTRPRDDPDRPPTGVFATRSPDRPNPIGLHEVRVLALDGPRVHVAPLEALDGTPVLDIKPTLGPRGDR